MEGVDVYVTSKAVDGKSLAELSRMDWVRGVFVRKITRGATATDIPILPNTKLERGDIVTLVGRTQDIAVTTKALGSPDRATDVADVAFIGAAIALGALVGAVVYKIGSVPLTLSTSGGALIAGLFFGWLRSVRPTFGRIPSSTVWFMNSVRIERLHRHCRTLTSGPKFVAGLQQLGFTLFLWGIVATTLPIILSMYIGRSLPLRRCDRPWVCIRRTYYDRVSRHGQRPRPKPDSGARLYGHIRRRKYAFDNLGNGPRHAARLAAAIQGEAPL